MFALVCCFLGGSVLLCSCSVFVAVNVRSSSWCLIATILSCGSNQLRVLEIRIIDFDPVFDDLLLSFVVIFS